MKSATNIAAETLFKLAAEAGAEDDILVQLNALAECFANNPEYATLLSTPNIPINKRIGLIDALAGHGLHAYVSNLLKVLAQQRFAGEFLKICRTYEKAADTARNTITAEVVSAFEIDAESQKRLLQKLEHMCGRQVKLNVKTEAELIGGFRIDIDGKRYDYTVQAQLKSLMGRLSDAED